MSSQKGPLGPLRGRQALVFLAVTLASLLGGCATRVHYLEASVKEIPSAQFRKPVAPRPAQLQFEFQTRGVLNASVTDMRRAEVVERLEASGLFSALDSRPQKGGGLLSVVVNNVPISAEDAYVRRFIGAPVKGPRDGTLVDGYVCIVRYWPPGQTTPVTVGARHALLTTVGDVAAPDSARKIDTLDTAITVMLREIVSTALYELSRSDALK